MTNNVCFECGKPVEPGRLCCSKACTLSDARKVQVAKRKEEKTERELRIQQLIKAVIHHDVA